MIEKLYNDAIALLCDLISTPSISKDEAATAEIIAKFLILKGVNIERLQNNVWAYNKYFDTSKPTILLNSHHDTVKPISSYSRDPFIPTIENGKLYGLGSNDAGASVVSLLATFLNFYDRKDLQYNLCVAITAEEEISGHNGVELLLPHLHNIEFAIVGEPTKMDLAVAERGLMVLDCKAIGKAGHAARNEGDNAIYKALKDIEWFKSYQFDKVSELFGDQKMTVTVINAGAQHNVVPSECNFTVDVRITDKYSHEEVVQIVKEHVSCEVVPRSFRLKPSSISLEHPIVKQGVALGRKTYGSPTTSDQSLMQMPSLKMGVGDSARSHMADEYVFLNEIEEGIKIYIELLSSVISERQLLVSDKNFKYRV
ncbi:MAG: M20 family metallo-hydrolase [Rikenellaceae bacterium]